MFPLNWKFLRHSYFQKIRGAGRRTDKRTDGQREVRGATLNAALQPHMEGGVKPQLSAQYMTAFFRQLNSTEQIRR